MAKKHKNVENIKIQWDGDLSKPSDGSAQSSPDNVEIVWGDNPYTWGDVSFVIELADGLGSGRRRQDRLDRLDDEKKKKLIRLICRVKGEKVYDEEKEVGDIQIKLEDAELVINEVLGKIKVEKADVL
tara:strand:+ start:410 stop:793 length:384 start_codon:yes stop_codon:yes gene_type:complete